MVITSLVVWDESHCDMMGIGPSATLNTNQNLRVKERTEEQPENTASTLLLNMTEGYSLPSHNTSLQKPTNVKVDIEDEN